METQLKILLLILAVLVGLIAVREYAPLSQDDSNLARYQEIVQIDPSTVREFQILFGETPLRFTRESGQWRVNEWQAEQASIDEFLATFSSPEAVQLVAETESRHAQLGVASASAVVSIQQERLLVGSESGDGYYISPDDSPVVFLVEPLPNNLTELTLTDWVDMSLLQADETTIDSISLTHSGQSLVLEQRDGAWYRGDATQALNTDSFNSLLLSVAAFEADGVLTQDEQDAFATTPALTLKVDQGEAPSTLNFFTGPEEQVMVTADTREGEAFYISQSRLETLMLSPEDIQETAEQTSD